MSVGMNPRTEKRINVILSRAEVLGFEEEIPKKDLEKLIIENVGHDKRTVRRYTELMIMYGKVWPKNRNVYVIVKPDTPTLEKFDVPEIKVERT